MERAYHFTSGVNWERIQDEGILRPYSTPEIPLLSFPINLYTPEQMERINRVKDSNPQFLNGKFIASIPDGKLDVWIEHGLLERVVSRCKDGITNQIVLLSYPISNEVGYVREHSHFSPKRCNELYGKDLSWFGNLFLSLLGGEEEANPDIEIILHQFELSANSVIELGKYDGSFEVPELWTPNTIPLGNLRMEQQFDFWKYFRAKSKDKQVVN